MTKSACNGPPRPVTDGLADAPTTDGSIVLGAVPALSAAGLTRIADIFTAIQLVVPRPLTTEDLLPALTTADWRVIDPGQCHPAERLTSALAALHERGVVISAPGGYALARLPADVSRRRRTLSLCGRAAVAGGRAVRAADVWSYATAYASREVEASGLSPRLVARDLLNLTRTGDVVVVTTVRGAAAAGRKLVVPAALVGDRESWLPAAPITWLEYVVRQIHELLATRHTRGVGASPRVFSTKELREHLRTDAVGTAGTAQAQYGKDLDDPMTVTRALQRLAASRTACVHPVEDAMGVWILADSGGGAETQSYYGCNTDRLIVGAKRALRECGRAVVTAAEVERAIECDESLRLTGTRSVALALSDLAKQSIDCGSGKRMPRKTQRLVRVGTVGGHPAYWVAGSTSDAPTLAQAKAAVALDGVALQVTRAKFDERLAALDAVLSPIVALGRARQMLSEIEELRGQLRALKQDTSEVAACAAVLERIATVLVGWVQFRGARARGAPTDLLVGCDGLTALELRDIFAPINDTAALLPTGAAVTRHYGRLIRRIRNPNFVSRRSGETRSAAEFLFDGVDARVYAARQWGGPTCQLLTLWAAEELGELRDARYLFAALKSENANIRLRVVDAVALLGSQDAREVLLRHARGDLDAAVRECALWALGMLLGEKANDLVREVGTTDSEARVRRAARRVLETGANWWWRV